MLDMYNNCRKCCGCCVVKGVIWVFLFRLQHAELDKLPPGPHELAPKNGKRNISFWFLKGGPRHPLLLKMTQKQMLQG
jgi:hypothetical protein